MDIGQNLEQNHILTMILIEYDFLLNVYGT